MPPANASGDMRTFQSANDEFYRAFTQADGGAMSRLWAQRAPVFCCHPGWPPIVGRAEILASWDEIFSHGGQPDIAFMPRQMTALGEVAIVCGIEILGNGQFACTNIFVLEEGVWRMAHHHAGPLAPGAFVQIVAPVDPGSNVRH